MFYPTLIKNQSVNLRQASDIGMTNNVIFAKFRDAMSGRERTVNIYSGADKADAEREHARIITVLGFKYEDGSSAHEPVEDAVEDVVDDAVEDVVEDAVEDDAVEDVVATDAVDDEALELRIKEMSESGVSMQEIADQLGKTRYAVGKILGKLRAMEE